MIFSGLVVLFFYVEFTGFDFEGFNLSVCGGEFMDDGRDGVESREVEIRVVAEIVEEGFPGESEGGFSFMVSRISDIENLRGTVFSFTDGG